jgi:iron complex outermembrane receptor protein
MCNKMILSAPFAIAALSWTVPAFAQTPSIDGQPESNAGAMDSSRTIEEVIVTATKRAQSIQDVSVAVSSVSAEQLKVHNIISVTELPNIAPSLKYNEAAFPGSAQFMVRGVGTFSFDDGLEPSVGVVIDGIPLGRSIGTVVDAVDVEQVQVLRGPQGTLFGKNATAGLIDLRFREANLYETSFTGRTSIGSYGEERIQGTANIPIVADRMALRASAWRLKRDGFIKAPLQEDGRIGDLDNRGVRLKVGISPVDAWRVDLTGEYSENETDAATSTVRGYSGADIARGLPAYDTALGIEAGPDNLTTGIEFPVSNHQRQYRFVGKSVYDLFDAPFFGDASITAIAGYVDTRSNAFVDSDNVDSREFLQTSAARPFADINQFTAELRVSSEGAQPLQYTAGLFYYDLDLHGGLDLKISRLEPPLLGLGTANNVETETYAAFADFSYDVGPVRFLAGGRYSQEQTSGTYTRGRSEVFPTPLILLGSLDVVTPVNEYDDFSWRAGVEYRPAEDVMVYATASRAYKGPGLNYSLSLNQARLDVNGGIVEAETAKSYEVGMRSQFFDNQLTANLTAFYSPFENFQVTAALPTTPVQYTNTNAGELLAKGVELEFGIHPHAMPGLSVNGFAVYNDTQYEEFPNAPCYRDQPRASAPTSTPGVCAPVAEGSTAFVQNVAGLRAVGAPEWQVGLTPRFEGDYGSHFRAFGQLHFQYNSAIQYGVGNDPRTEQEPYHTIDLSAGFGDASGRWTLSANIRNVTENSFVSRIAFATGLTQHVPFQSLRSYSLALDVSF